MSKRKPGISMADLRDHYEARTPDLARAVGPLLRRYKRTYLTPVALAPGGGVEGAYDVFTEFWFDSQEDFAKAFGDLAASPKAAEIAIDEANFFDPATITFFVTEERETEL
jgi:uncharacterized protein (TIGR02118 family)